MAAVDHLAMDSERNMILLAIADTMHDMWRGYRSATKRSDPEDIDRFRDYLIRFIKRKYNTVITPQCGAPATDMQNFLSSCLNNLPQRYIVPSKIEKDTVNYFEALTTLNQNGIHVSTTYSAILNIDGELDRCKESDSLSIDDTEGIYNDLTEDQCNIIAEFIQMYLYRQDNVRFGITFDSAQNTISTIFNAYPHAVKFITPQNIADSASTSTAPFREANQYFMPTQSAEAFEVPGAAGAGAAAAIPTFTSHSTMFSKGIFKIEYVPIAARPLTDADHHGFTYDIVSETRRSESRFGHIAAGNGLGARNVVQGPSADYLLELQLRLFSDPPCTLAHLANINTQPRQVRIGLDIGLVQNSIGQEVIALKNDNPIFLDIKRAGDWDQIDAAIKSEEQLRALADDAVAAAAAGAAAPAAGAVERKIIVATGDLLCSLKSRILKKNCIIQSDRSLTIYRSELNVPQQIVQSINLIIHNINLFMRYQVLLNTPFNNNIGAFCLSIYQLIINQEAGITIPTFMETLRLCDMYEFLMKFGQTNNDVANHHFFEVNTLYQALHDQLQGSNNLLALVDGNVNVNLDGLRQQFIGLQGLLQPHANGSNPNYTDDILGELQRISEITTRFISRIHTHYETIGITRTNLSLMIDTFQNQNQTPFNDRSSYSFLNYDPILYTAISTREIIIDTLINPTERVRAPTNYIKTEVMIPADSFNDILTDIINTFQSTRRYNNVQSRDPKMIKFQRIDHTLQEYLEHIKLFINTHDLGGRRNRGDAIMALRRQINDINGLLLSPNPPANLYTHILGNLTPLPDAVAPQIQAAAALAADASQRQAAVAAAAADADGAVAQIQADAAAAAQAQPDAAGEIQAAAAGQIQAAATAAEARIQAIVPIEPVPLASAVSIIRRRITIIKNTIHGKSMHDISQAISSGRRRTIREVEALIHRYVDNYMGEFDGINLSYGNKRHADIKAESRREIKEKLNQQLLVIRRHRRLRRIGGGNGSIVEDDEPVLYKLPANPYFQYLALKKICNQAADWLKSILINTSTSLILLNIIYIELLSVRYTMERMDYGSMMNHVNNIIQYSESYKPLYTIPIVSDVFNFMNEYMKNIITKKKWSNNVDDEIDKMIRTMKSMIDMGYDQSRNDLIKEVYAKNDMSIMMEHFYEMKYDWDFEMRVHEGQPDGITSYFDLDPINTMVSFALLSEELDGAIAQDRSIISKICGYVPEVSLTHRAAWSELVDRLSSIYQKQILSDHEFENEFENEFKSELENEFKSELENELENEQKSEVKTPKNSNLPVQAKQPVNNSIKVGGNRTRKHRGHKTQRKKHGARKTKSKRRFGTQRKKQNRK